MKRVLCLAFLLAVLGAYSVNAQIYTLGSDPSRLRWRSIETENYRIIFPESADSLAREYAKSLEKFRNAIKSTIGFAPNELYKRKMPVILHACTAESNGMVTWANRRMELFSNPDAYNPESTPWIDQLTVHEGRHVAQMQFPRANRVFRGLEYFIGELSTGAAVTVYPGPALLEGDAVVAETALSNSGRGRTADFLEYYHVAFADSLYRDFWQWRWGSQNRYTPDHYRAGYALIAGMRTTFADTLFSKNYYDYINSRFLPYRALDKTIVRSAGKNLYGAFKKIQHDFTAEWAAADSARAPFIEGEDFVSKGRLYDTYTSLVSTDKGLYALHAGLDRARELVLIKENGRVKKLGAFASQTSRLAWDKNTRRLIWSEYRPSPVFEMESFSRLCWRDEAGNTGTFGPEGRLYNPAACEADSLVAAVQYFENGMNCVTVLRSWSGNEVEAYFAPDKLQPVEVAWIDSSLFVTAISEEGFGIYSLPDWKTVLAPAHAKINRFFGRDGLLWFTSDRSGVNELHSLGADGILRQRTSSRFGANEFAFAGDSLLYYSAPTADARIVRRISTDSLPDIRTSFGPMFSERAEKLSAQEPLMPSEYTGTIPESKPYLKILHPPKIHSWAPAFIDYDPVERLSLQEPETQGGMGGTVFFQNDLGTAYGFVGVNLLALKDTLGTGYTMADDEAFLPVEFRPSLHAQYIWQGWGPVIKLRGDFGERNIHCTDYTKLTSKGGSTFSEKNYIGDKPLVNLSASISLPLDYSKGGWYRGVIPTFQISWQNDCISSLDVSKSGAKNTVTITPHDHCVFSRASIQAYKRRPVAQSGIYPRLGIGTEIGVTSTHNLSDSSPGHYYSNFYGYLPGLMSTHGLRLEAGALSNYGWQGKWIKYNQISLGADYVFPFAPLSYSGLSPFFYIRNLEGRLGARATITSYKHQLTDKEGVNQTCSVSAALLVRLSNFLWAPYDTRIGVKFNYNVLDPSKSWVEPVFSMPL